MPTAAIRIMGILNATPDSFSDGGRHFTLQAAMLQVERMIAAGVDIIDIGGESTRPFAEPVSPEEELGRVIPLVREIRRSYSTAISIDTTKAAVARAALDSGADIINDISAMEKDKEMLALAAATTVPFIIMHMQGTPETMQVNPHYDNVVEDILAYFRKRVAQLEDKGIDRGRLIIDPGIGFGKNLEHNLSILKHLKRFSELGLRVLLGHSRKRFLRTLTGLEASECDLPTAVVSALAVDQGVSIIRVHDVAATRQALLIAEAIRTAP
ncbi:MAG: dihydropteroate synthase [Desulfocapsaceae bacterium]|nr:dihydropteroate synthase [Desulfocapsaceae bacterium]